MKVLVCNKPGELEYQQMEKPIAEQGQAILKIKRIGICGTDLHAYEGTQPYFNYPRILGHELALEVEDADGFQKGEAVTIIPYFHCGTCIACRTGKTNCCVNMRVFGVHVDGGMKEYISVPLSSVIRGQGLGFDELALVEPLAIGAHAVRRANILPGEFVLVIGAGPIGLGIIEFARIAGGNVVVLDINEQRLAFCKEKLKIANTINAAAPDVMDQLKKITNDDMPTVVIDATGSLKAVNNAFQYMAHGARFVLVGLQKENISFSHPEFHKREATLMSSRNATHEDFEQVINCMNKKLVDPATYITHRVKFEDVKDNFKNWLNPSNGVIKAMVEMNG
ncbi:MAG: zinc-binding alcohol dehydrogenase family protein [Chitinophagaceae bacterium]